MTRMLPSRKPPQGLGFDLSLSIVLICSIFSVLLMFTCEAIADNTRKWAKWSPDYYDSRPNELLAVIFPGATFFECEKLDTPKECLNNKNKIISALRVLNKLNYIRFGKSPPLKEGDVQEFFEGNFIDIARCLAVNCAHSINYEHNTSKINSKTWISLGRYLYCKYVMLTALEQELPDIPRSNTENRRLTLVSRDKCIGADFPAHLLEFVTKPHQLFGNSRY